jgi:glycerophosphoryl diester phosphodiesterase
MSEVVDAGIRFLELDLRTTTHHEVVVWHGDGRQRVQPSKALEPRTLPPDKREGLLRLESVVIALPADVRYFLDIKDVPTTKSLPPLVARLNLQDRVCIGSFSHRRTTKTADEITRLTGTKPCRAMTPWQALGLLARSLRPGKARTSSWTSESISAQIPGWLAVPRVIAAAHAAGIFVTAWTINDKRQLDRLLQRGVDGVMTDKPVEFERIITALPNWSPTN